METKQVKEWSGQFGKEYTDRNPQTIEEMNGLYLKSFGISRTSLNEEFLGGFDRSLRMLEVGANVGSQLQGLQEMGFKDLYGIELQQYAVEVSKNKTKNINLIQGSAFDIPFKDNFFDLVYTSGVLIHISPDDVGKALDEIFRCSRKYIWGFEYFAPACTEVGYRGQAGLLWKTDFAKLYLDRYPSLKLVKEKRVKYLDSENMDTMYLLEKKG